MKEALKLALEALNIARNQLKSWELGDEAITAIKEALSTKCVAQPEPVDFASLLREAEEIVREKPARKRFIDSTPLSNDIAVWMTVFAQDVARRTSPPAKPLTDKQALDALDAAGIEMKSGVDCAYELKIFRAAEAAHGVKE